MRRVGPASLLTLTMALSACGAPDLGARPQLHAPPALDSRVSLASTNLAAQWPREEWWTAYGDPQLNALVAEALADAPDVAVAQARILQARGVAEQAGAATLPSLGATGKAGLAKQSYNNGIPANFVPRGWKSTGTLALSGDFDLDLWGKNRKALAAATSEAQAAEADARQAELLISSNVVSSYFDLARLMARADALDEAVKARETMVSLTQARVKQGLDNEAPLRRAQAEAAAARGTRSANSEQIALRRHAIAALLGKGPDRGLTITPPMIDAIPETVLPADAGIALAGRRPDIVAARLRAEAASSRIDVAKAAFLPDISLSGLIGLTSLGLSNLIDTGSTYGNVGGAFSLPIFQGGRLKGQFTQARGAYDAAVANYNATVVGALQDVADALASRNAAKVQEAEASAARDSAKAAHALAAKRFQGGLASYLDTLDAETAALDAREASIDAHFRSLALEVALKRALGGGFADSSIEKATDDE